MPTASTLFTSRGDMQSLLGLCGVDLKINDSETTVISPVEEGYLNWCISAASSRVSLFLANRYSPQVLLQVPMVIWWATVISCYMLSMRRCNTAAGSLQAMYESAMKDLSDASTGMVQLGGVPSLATPGISMSNVRMDPTWAFKTMRVEQQISANTPTRAPVIVDIYGQFWQDPNSLVW